MAISVSCKTLEIAKVKINNQEWCGDKGPFGAKCFNTLNKNTREIPKATWDKIAIGNDHRFGMVCTTSDVFAELKETMLKLCKATKRCTYEDQQKAIAFVNQVEKNLTEAKAIESIQGIIEIKEKN